MWTLNLTDTNITDIINATSPGSFFLDGNLSENYSSNYNSDYYNSNYYDYTEPQRDVKKWALALLKEPPYTVMILLSLVATVANLVTLPAIVMARSKTPYFRLILNLAISDLTISLSTIGHFIHLILYPSKVYDLSSAATYNHCMFMVLKSMNNIGLMITLLTLMGMAIDQYIAILHPFRYQTLMSKQRSTIMLASFWCISILCGFSDLFTGFQQAKHYKENAMDINYCAIVLFATAYAEEYIVFAIAFICCAVMMYIYVKIYGEVKKQRQRVPVSQEFVRNNKALITTLIILGTFLLCWLPLCVFEISMVAVARHWGEFADNNHKKLTKVNLCLLDLLLVNTILDPLIYSVRMTEVRLSFKNLFCRCDRVQPRRGSYFDNASHISMVTMSTNASRKPSKVSLASAGVSQVTAIECVPILPENLADVPKNLADVPETVDQSLV